MIKILCWLVGFGYLVFLWAVLLRLKFRGTQEEKPSDKPTRKHQPFEYDPKDGYYHDQD